ncbi:MAG TPA: malonate decarboxylase subunit alpha [bacterium]|nr:malonate decarboxylase subunit alpha [bacterium]HPQ19428.1 malonate decarboxylase subunit alpha [bacterium]
MDFEKLKKDYEERILAGKKFCLNNSKFIRKEDTSKLLESVIKKGDKVCVEGDNQKQADFLARELLKVDTKKVNNIHFVQSSIVLNEHIEFFNKGIGKKLDFAYSGPQSKKLYQLVVEKKVQIGAIHTYLELYGRYFVDLTPRVALLVAESCDDEGNIYTGFNTEDTPLLCEATKFKYGIVIIQVKNKVKELPRVDIPASWVDFIIVTNEDYFIQPLFTRDPAKITNMQIAMAMMVLKGIYLKYGVKSLNHGLGFATAAIELILPTYGNKLKMKGKYCTHWVLNPHPTLIPAIEKGFVQRIYCFGGEPGMENYVKNRPDIFFIGADGNLRSNRCYAHIAGLYAIDLFIGATLQIDKFGNSSTAIKGMIAGFGGAPNLGGTPPGRRHFSEAFKNAGYFANNNYYGRKLVVQITPTVSEKKGIPVFVEELDAKQFLQTGLFETQPVMIVGDQITHIVTEKGIAYLDLCRDLETRMKAIAAIAGETKIGQSITKAEVKKLRAKKIVQTPEDLGININEATPKLLAAKNFDDLIKISKNLYYLPAGIKGD